MDALRLNTAVVAGAAAGTHIAVAAIKAGDLLVAVQRVDAAGANLGGLNGEFTVEADGYINNPTTGTNTTGFLILVMWYEMGAYRDMISAGTITGRSAF